MMDFACTGTRGNWYDRCFYMRGETTHANQYPYLSVNRRSNMASLLSEGAYHTIAAQQQLNINTEYKRLEALAAFQSILKYRGLNVPKQTFLAGIVSNSENNTPINGVKVSVGGRTYTTDTWESVTRIGFNLQRNLSSYAGPGHWNDPDMLEVGNGKLTFEENKKKQ